jgi:hypothetical protein
MIRKFEGRLKMSKLWNDLNERSLARLAREREQEKEKKREEIKRNARYTYPIVHSEPTGPWPDHSPIQLMPRPNPFQSPPNIFQRPGL